MFQIKDLTVSVLPGRGVLLGPNCRISATDPGMPCGPRSASPRPRPRNPKAPKPPQPVTPEPGPALSAACGHEREHEYEKGPRRATGLEDLRRELRAQLAPR